MQRIFFFLSLFLLFFVFASNTKAQSNAVTPFDIKNETNIYVSPQNPQKGQDFEVSIESYSLNLDASTISFYANDVLIQKELGNKKAIIPNKSTVTVVRILIETSQGNFIEKEKIVYSNSLSLVWNAQTTVPPFYKGKALLSDGSEVIISAITEITDENNKQIPQELLIFTWKVNGKTKLDLSGIGKSEIVISDVVVDDKYKIFVTAESRDQKYTATNYLEISFSNPKVLLYETDPLFGPSSYALSNSKTTKNELGVVAVPFFFKKGAQDNVVSFTWRVNGETAKTKSNRISLRNEKGGEGYIEISILAESLLDKFQRFSKKITLEAIK